VNVWEPDSRCLSLLSHRGPDVDGGEVQHPKLIAVHGSVHELPSIRTGHALHVTALTTELVMRRSPTARVAVLIRALSPWTCPG
jgi:hypothetical protein